MCRVFSETQSVQESRDVSLSTDTMTASFSSATGLLQSITRPGAEVGITMAILYACSYRLIAGGGCCNGSGDV